MTHGYEGLEQDGLSPEELDSQSGEQLPDREAMSLVKRQHRHPVDAAVAANVLSDGAAATAADQPAPEPLAPEQAEPL